MRRSIWGVFLFVLSGCATLAPARDGWSVVGGGGESTRDWGDLGRITGRGLALVGFDKSMVRSPDATQLGELAFVALTQTPEDPKPIDVCTGVLEPNTPQLGTVQYMNRCAQRHVTSFGVSVSPVGVAVPLVRGDVVRSTFDLLGGGALFNHDVPFPNAMPFSFSASAGVSVTFGTRWPNRSIATIGYRLQHYSNAGLSRPNPAIGIQMFFLRWTPRPESAR